MDIDVSQGKIIVLAVGKNNDYPKFVRLIDNTTHILIASSSAIAGGYIDGDRMQIYHMSVN